MMDSRALGLILSAALLLSSCAKRMESEAPAPVTADPGDGAMKAGADGRDAMGPLEIVSTGEAPRRTLSYRLSPGQTERMTARIDLTVTTHLAGEGAQSFNVPPYEMLAATTCTGLNADGNYEIRSTVERVEVLLPEDADQGTQTMGRSLQKEISNLIGLPSTTVMTPQGETLSATYDTEGLSESVAQNLDTLSRSIQQGFTPFPTEAVGVGAQWRQSGVTHAQDIALDTETVYTLKSLTETEAVLAFTVRQRAGSQPMQPDDTMPDMTLTLIGMRGDTTGEVRVALDRLVNVSETTAQIAIETRGEAMGMVFETEVVTLLGMKVGPASE